MKYVYIFLFIPFLANCQPAKKITQENGKISVEKSSGNMDSTAIRGNIYELSTGDRLKLSDIWINDTRYDCDTNGHFYININPGKYNVEARSFGFKNYKYKLSIEKGEICNLLFYLIPFKMRDLLNKYAKCLINFDTPCCSIGLSSWTSKLSQKIVR